MVMAGNKRVRAKSAPKKSMSKKARATYSQPQAVKAFSAPGPLPIVGSVNRKQKFCLTYHNKTTIPITTLGLSQGYRFRINSIYDVEEATGLNEQPSGYDELASMYERYRVYRVDYKISMKNNATGDRVIAGVTVCDQDPGPISGINWRRLVESGNTRWKYLGRVATDEHASAIVEFAGTVDLSKLNGKTWAQYFSDDTFGATMGSNPADENYLVAWYQPMGTTTNNAMDIVYEFNYHIEVEGNKFMSLSS